MARMRIEWRGVDEVTPYENNPRDNEGAVEYVANSIREFGWKQPIVVDSDGVIIAWHTRHKAAKRLGMDKVPVVVASDLTPAQVNAYRLADNKTAEMATWDAETLREELEGLQVDFDMGVFGFDDMDLREPELEEITAEEDEIPELSTPRCKAGDVWQLGDHRLICGDSTNPRVIEALMDGEQADLLLTDPPYNVDLGSKNRYLTLWDKMNRIEEDIEGDVYDAEEYGAFIQRAINATLPSLRAGAAYYIWFAAWHTRAMYEACEACGLQVRQSIYWIKNTITLGRQDYQWQTEPCLYGWKEGTHWFAPTRAEHNVIDSLEDLKKMDRKQLLEYVEWLIQGDSETDAVREDKPRVNGVHPTMKPVALFARLIRNSTQRGETVLDVFAGSGTTAIACEQMGRRARMVELTEGYCDVAIERWEQFTGRKAQLLRRKEDAE